LSSTESMISEIEENYSSILKKFRKYVKSEGAKIAIKDFSEDELISLLRDLVKFQKRIEYFLYTAKRLVKNTIHFEKLERIAENVSKKFSSDVVIDTVIVYSTEETVLGAISNLKKAHRYLLHGESFDSKRKLYCAYIAFRLLQHDLIELEEEMRLISALTTYPIEKRIELKGKLVSENFEEVAISLEEAETNVEEEHFRDCISRCRDAVEIFVSTVKERETGEKSEKRFSIDIGKIVKHGIYDEAIQRLAQGVYSFLSLKGSHKYDEKKITIYDAEIALQETYSLVEVLLQKYIDFKNQKVPANY